MYIYYTDVGEMEEHSVHHVGYRGAGIFEASLEHIFLRNPLSDTGSGQHRQREAVSHERRIVSNAWK